MKNLKAEPAKSETTFLVDGMLGSLARKLRMLGYDTLYSEDDDSKLLAMAKSTGRYLVTSDSELFYLSRRRKLNSIFVASRTERGRLLEVLSAVGESRIDFRREAKCSACNGQLKDSGRKQNDKPILKCVECGKDYWKGSHWKRLSALFNEVDAMLRASGK
jgi:uncharacterized protein with PIN domain